MYTQLKERAMQVARWEVRGSGGSELLAQHLCHPGPGGADASHSGILSLKDERS